MAVCCWAGWACRKLRDLERLRRGLLKPRERKEKAQVEIVTKGRTFLAEETASASPVKGMGTGCDRNNWGARERRQDVRLVRGQDVGTEGLLGSTWLLTGTHFCLPWLSLF